MNQPFITRRRCRVRPRTGSRAFTLIETLVAVVILGLLAGLATWSFSGPLRRASFDEAVEQIRHLDATSRHLARETGRPVRMVLDAGAGSLSRRSSREAAGDVYSTKLPPGVRIDRIRTPALNDTATARIDVSQSGLSPSYAVRLAGPDWRRWVFVAGLSGELRVISDDAEISAIFEAAQAARRDAD